MGEFQEGWWPGAELFVGAMTLSFVLKDKVEVWWSLTRRGKNTGFESRRHGF
jgi:hypothetical protein